MRFAVFLEREVFGLVFILFAICLLYLIYENKSFVNLCCSFLRKLRRPAVFILRLKTAGLGIEPRYQAPKARVLPLDDPAMEQSQD